MMMTVSLSASRNVASDHVVSVRASAVATSALPFPEAYFELPANEGGAYFASTFGGVQNVYRTVLVAILQALRKAKRTKRTYDG